MERGSYLSCPRPVHLVSSKEQPDEKQHEENERSGGRDDDADEAMIVEYRVGETDQSNGVGDEGALVIVRPDGYVGTVAPLSRLKDVDVYFASFMHEVL